MNDFIAGFIGGSVSITSIYPTEYLKYRLQIEQNSNLRKIIINTFRTYGLLGFYRGWSKALINIAIRTSIQNGIYQNIKKRTNNGLIAGIGTGMVTAFTSTPMNNIITKNIYSHINKDLIIKLNFMGLFKGLNAAIYKDMLSATLLFYGYDLINSRVNNSWLSGGIAGMICSTINNPLDVIQSRLQTNYSGYYKSPFDTAIKMYKNEGIKSFYKGCTLRMLRPVPGRAIMFYTIEQYKKFSN